MTADLPHLLLLSCAALVGLAFSSLLLLRAQARQQKLAQRIAAATAGHARTRRVEAPVSLRAPAAGSSVSLAHRIALLFGFDPKRQDQLPVRWWVVIAASVVVARFAATLAQDMIGGFGIALWPIATIGLSRFAFGWFRRRRKDVLFRQFPDALSMIVRSVRAGIPVSESIRVVARESPEPTATEFGRMAGEIAIGVSMEDALRGMAERNDLPEYRFFATALSLQAQTGGGLTETLENLADVIRKRVAAKARGHALASEAKTSAAILAGLPIVTGLLLWVINPGYINLLFTDPTGHKVLGAAAGSLSFGIFVMRTIIQKSLS